MNNPNVNKIAKSLQNPNIGNTKAFSFNEVQEVADVTEEFDYDKLKKEAELRKEYNANLTNLDPRYTSLEPNTSKVIVRVYVEEIPESGLITSVNSSVAAPTKSGVGTRDIENKYTSFTRKAIVVSSSNTSYVEGSLVQLAEQSVTPRGITVGGEHYLMLEFGFTHYEYTDKIPPTEVTDKDFGYFLVPVHLIDCKIG